MASERIRTKAIVTLTVEVEIPVTFSSHAMMNDVCKDAAERACTILETRLKDGFANVRLVSDPKVTTVTTYEAP